ncbi:hypothetical protein [Novosphingobium sp.]|uniref:hypothetical protein n=1 Tax=Novosphingobium sp. TaxID=1874826 RepID=UPI0028AAFA6E|nr:hypothetical protein [Novosphingobium sp.]
MAGEWGMRIKRNGAEEMNPFTNMGRIIGQVSTNGVNGSVTDAGFATGVVEWALTTLEPPSVLGSTGYAPEVSISGTTLSWNYKFGSSTFNTIITYWVR